MKALLRTILIVVLLAFGAQAADAPPKKLQVLFIGNSLTSYNNLPAIIAAMAAASGRELTFSANLVGGATLEKHWNEGKALAKIKDGHWDYVVLQDLSTEAYTGRDSMFRHSRLFDAEIHKVGARTVFYMTWALETAPDKFPLIEEAYTTLAKELKASLVPAGAAWHTLTSSGEKPTIQLYLPDHKHPTPAGSYLAACVFYRVLFGVPSATVPGEIPGQKIPKQEAEALQKIADAVSLPITNTLQPRAPLRSVADSILWLASVNAQGREQPVSHLAGASDDAALSNCRPASSTRSRIVKPSSCSSA